MDVKFLKIVVLAMDVDGEFQQQELDMLKHIITTHPEFRGISDSDTIQAMGELYNKISVGMERKHIVEQLTPEFNDTEKQMAFALASEICAADFNIVPAETDFLTMLIDMWAIPDDVVLCVRKSIALRYSNRV